MGCVWLVVRFNKYLSNNLIQGVSMKTSIYSFVVFFLFLVYSVLFIGCSQESSITAPNVNEGTTMAKSVAIPTVTLNKLLDTTISLPISKLNIVISKSYPVI